MIILYIVLGVIVITLLAAVIRALAVKPTAAEAALPEVDEERSRKYAEKLGAMIACETVSWRGQKEVPKFYAYQKVLGQQFPAVFEK